ncbi:MAG: hypothetical protein RL716_367 [Actinomycetota bacterium]
MFTFQKIPMAVGLALMFSLLAPMANSAHAVTPCSASAGWQYGDYLCRNQRGGARQNRHHGRERPNQHTRVNSAGDPTASSSIASLAKSLATWAAHRGSPGEPCRNHAAAFGYTAGPKHQQRPSDFCPKRISRCGKPIEFANYWPGCDPDF